MRLIAHGRAVQGVHELRSGIASDPRLEPPGREVEVVRARGELAVLAFRGEPDLDVVLLGRGCAEISRRDVCHPVGQPQGTDQRFLDREDSLVLLPRSVRRDDRVHLELVELVHPEDALRVLAVGARLAPEVGGEAAVPDRQRVGGEQRRRGSAPRAGPRSCRRGRARRQGGRRPGCGRSGRTRPPP